MGFARANRREIAEFVAPLGLVRLLTGNPGAGAPGYWLSPPRGFGRPCGDPDGCGVRREVEHHVWGAARATMKSRGKGRRQAGRG
jgi:hypothetical protein